MEPPGAVCFSAAVIVDHSHLDWVWRHQGDIPLAYGWGCFQNNLTGMGRPTLNVAPLRLRNKKWKKDKSCWAPTLPPLTRTDTSCPLWTQWHQQPRTPATTTQTALAAMTSLPRWTVPSHCKPNKPCFLLAPNRKVTNLETGSAVSPFSWQGYCRLHHEMTPFPDAPFPSHHWFQVWLKERLCISASREENFKMELKWCGPVPEFHTKAGFSTEKWEARN